ncbi:MAG TPA: beta-L-arabinofuranosidase domain-containing protein [Candidatus Limnocylindrales bacterium]|nr:beta-L-arabinofuranosidase domain-containing protein [Candidatus Limnocylindrales bacterium]
MITTQIPKVAFMLRPHIYPVLIAAISLCGEVSWAESTDNHVSTVVRPATSAASPVYTANRQPLVPSAFVKLPIGSIAPRGWLLHQLQLEADGMTGHLEEISKWCKFENSAWASADGHGQFGWEELPYWLKGYGDLGYVLKNPQIIQHSRKWIDAVLASQEPGGYFGPRANKTGLEGKPDLWPHMVMCNVLESFYEFTGDSRVLPFLTKYFQWLNTQPGENFGAGYWPKIRFGDNIESIYWLYNHTGDGFLLELAKKIHDNMARWDGGVVNWHNVNIAEGFREPGVYYQQAADQKFLDAAERNYQTVIDRYGQFPGGGFAGDENCRPGFTDPRQGFETCGMVEFMHSFEMLTKISGNPIWSDRCEEMAFNSLPAALTPDQKALHYLTCANQVQLDKGNKSPGVENEGTMFSYSPFEVYRCCQHNVSHGWPYFAEELWLGTPDRGICASLYAPSEVTAKVGQGGSVTINEQTDYPFDSVIQLTISAAEPAKFPLYLRIPRWCQAASIRVNGQHLALKTEPLHYVRIERIWHNGDRVKLELPMQITVRRWEKNNQAASVDYGPLTFSLKIGERWSRYGGTDAWPETEVFPTNSWNYGLVLDAKSPAKSFKVVRKSGPLAVQPFTPQTAPIELRAKAKRIPSWKQDALGLVGKLQPSPVTSDQPVETVTLIPMGAARLRISAFPVIGTGPDAHEWPATRSPPVSASHCCPSDSVEAVVDGLEPKNSNDHSIPRFTWWDHRGTSEWVQYEFAGKRKVSSVQVYWFDDSGVGSCRVPQSWQILFREAEHWTPVTTESAYEVKRDKYNRVAFKPVATTGLRLEVKLQREYSAGILQWKVAD